MITGTRLLDAIALVLAADPWLPIRRPAGGLDPRGSDDP